MQEKKILGKGLSALIGENNTVLQSNTNFLYLDINNIIPNPNQPRKTFPEHEIAELSDSIKIHGILQPIIVTRQSQSSNNYIIVAGERRWRASIQAKLQTLPAIVLDKEESSTYEISLVENIQRQDLNSIEEAQAYDYLIKTFDYTQDDIAKKVSKSRSHVANTLRLLSLPQEVKDMIIDGRLSYGHAKTIASSEDPLKLANEILQNNLTVRQAEALTKSLKTKSGDNIIEISPHKRRFDKDADILEIERLLSDNLGLKVYVNDTSRGGQVVINFNTLDDLDTIIQKITHSGLNF